MNIKDEEEKRKNRNLELVKRMKDPNDSLSSFNLMDSFFPPRPLIKKDQEALLKLYSKKDVKE